MNNKQRYLFLDIDGVLNTRDTYEMSHATDGLCSLTQDEITAFNKLDITDLGLFCTEGRWGEVYSKAIVSRYSHWCREHDVKVIIISSGVSIYRDKDIKDGCKYWSDLWDMDIVDMFTGGCGIDTRVRRTVKWLSEFGGDDYLALIVDDMRPNHSDIEFPYAALYNPKRNKDDIPEIESRFRKELVLSTNDVEYLMGRMS